jgi:hypothetical protein
MKCIFCKEDSESSKSIEHIIPESLGNKLHILEKGIVCDKCNNYFASKIEKEVLELSYFKSLRHRNQILNKKRKLPKEKGFVLRPKIGEIEIVGRSGNIFEIEIENKELYNLFGKEKTGKLYVPILPMPPENNPFISRLLGKIALEALADRLKKEENWNEHFVEHKDLDDLRNYVRYGKGSLWSYHMRKIYKESDYFVDNIESEGVPYQILHEYDFLYIENYYLFFICVIMGVEYTINMAESDLQKYFEWLNDNNNKSPLFEDIQSTKNCR